MWHEQFGYEMMKHIVESYQSHTYCRPAHRIQKQNAECGMQIKECRIQNAEYRIQNAECGIQNAYHRVQSCHIEMKLQIDAPTR